MAIRKAYPDRAIVAVVAITASLGGLAFSHPASASIRNSETVYSEKVRVGDLDLSTEAGAQQAVTRIHRAARDVCIQSQQAWSSFELLQPGYIRCVKDASNRAVAQVNSPMVTAANSGHKSIQLAEAKTSP